MSVEIITDPKALGAAITKIGLAGKKLDAAIHRAAVSALAHAHKSGDACFVEKLLNVMPKGSRIKGLIAWVRDHAPVDIRTKNGEFLASNRKGWKPEEFKLAEAAATPYWEHTVEKDPTPLTVARLVAYLKNKADPENKRVEDDARALASKMLAVLSA